MKKILGVWIWQPVTSVPTDTYKTYIKSGIRLFYLHRGSLIITGGHPGLQSADSSSSGFLKGFGKNREKGWFVYNFSPEIRKSFSLLKQTNIRNGFIRIICKDLKYSSRGANLNGVQIDFDGPESNLEEYSLFLTDLRTALKKIIGDKKNSPVRISITVLPSWTDHPSFLRLISLVDEYVPMFYQGEANSRLDDFKPLLDPQKFKTLLKLYSGLGKPFYAGIGAYGIAYFYSPAGKLEYMDSGLDQTGFLSDPHVMMTGSKRYFSVHGRTLEMVSYYQTTGPVLTHDYMLPAGWTVVFDRITAAGTCHYWEEVKLNHSPFLRGAILFRMPGKNDPLVMQNPMLTGRLLADDEGSPSFSVEVLEQRKPSLVFRIQSQVPKTVDLLADGKGSFCQIRIENGGFLSIEQGGFDEMEWGYGKNESIEPCSLQRANVIRLYQRLGHSGDSVISGNIEISKMSDRIPQLYMYEYFSTDHDEKEVPHEKIVDIGN